jgi:hypothetical protein
MKPTGAAVGLGYVVENRQPPPWGLEGIAKDPTHSAVNKGKDLSWARLKTQVASGEGLSSEWPPFMMSIGSAIQG